MPDEHKLSEDEAWETALNDHPELRRAWEAGTLPDEITGEDGNVTNPQLHLALHAMVERQIATDEPPGVAAVARALAKRGVSHHEIRHVIGQPLTEQIWYMNKEGCPFDEKRYLRQLQDVVDSQG